ncbi:MAG: pseudouridine-5'-phosphate glycosidase [Thermoleophilia bacterium]
MEFAFSPPVAAALGSRRPVVALESTIIAHGLPRPDNLEVARRIEDTVREQGAVPATIAVLDGTVHIGLDDAQLETLASRTDIAKAGVRDLGPALARRMSAATTVASTAHLAALAGIRVFATGGLGGVHREASETFDESADLTALANTRIIVVCAGVKSILDVAATLERLETLSVPVLCFGTDRFPGFYLTDSGQPAPWRVDTQQEVAEIAALRAELGLDQAIVVAQPLPAGEQLDPGLHDRVLSRALADARAQGITGKAATPFILARFHEQTAGASLDANVRLVLRNAGLAARIAAALKG